MESGVQGITSITVQTTFTQITFSWAFARLKYKSRSILQKQGNIDFQNIHMFNF